ncbi:MAG: 3-methyl-2-oxobutanoate hydroxymethyltransferase [Planctomycetota bacterium]
MSKPITAPRLREMKNEGRKIVMITAYDYPSACIAEEAGVDVILVGDSLGMVVQGHHSTLPVTLEESLYHTRIVSRACSRTMVIGDMPFGTYHQSTAHAIDAASRYMKEAGAHAVKLEGGANVVEQIRALTRAQIPVCAHIGLTPQSIHVFGGFKVQRVTEKLLADAKAVQDAGAMSVVIECVTADIAKQITAELEIPTIGIGAGVDCDGQVLVWHDLLGLGDPSRKLPRFVKPYASLYGTIRDALVAYRDEVQGGTFPGPANTYEP